MGKPSKLFLLLSFLVLSPLSLLRAQTSAAVPADANAAASPVPAGQAPDEMTKKVTELAHAGKYAEAQKLTEGLLIAYPNDQRLIKAKALIERLSAAANPTSTTPGSSQPAQPAADAHAEQLTGMDKVDYNTLILLAKQALQETDLSEQRKLLNQYMDRSNVFLQEHPDQMLLWELRAQSALSLDDPMAGYEAGQKLLSAGAADSNDPSLEQLLAQLNKKGWLDKQLAEKEADRLAQEAQEQEARETWTDTASGLTWTTKDNGVDVTWQQAMDYCRNLQLAGHSDWRLPTIDELQGIYDANAGGHNVKGNLQLTNSWEWSSSKGNASGERGYFYFSYGNRLSYQLDLSSNLRALCARHPGEMM